MDANSNNKSGSDEQMMDILLVFDKEKKTINVSASPFSDGSKLDN